jgi:hypothetical protein
VARDQAVFERSTFVANDLMEVEAVAADIRVPVTPMTAGENPSDGCTPHGTTREFVVGSPQPEVLS